MPKIGLSQRDYENIAREDWYRFAVRPAIVILGIFIVSAILQTVLDIGWKRNKYF